jgi:hypothetical protein
MTWPCHQPHIQIPSSKRPRQSWSTRHQVFLANKPLDERQRLVHRSDNGRRGSESPHGSQGKSTSTMCHFMGEQCSELSFVVYSGQNAAMNIDDCIWKGKDIQVKIPDNDNFKRKIAEKIGGLKHNRGYKKFKERQTKCKSI